MSTLQELYAQGDPKSSPRIRYSILPAVEHMWKSMSKHDWKMRQVFNVVNKTEHDQLRCIQTKRCLLHSNRKIPPFPSAETITFNCCFSPNAAGPKVLRLLGWVLGHSRKPDDQTATILRTSLNWQKRVQKTYETCEDHACSDIHKFKLIVERANPQTNMLLELGGTILECAIRAKLLWNYCGTILAIFPQV